MKHSHPRSPRVFGAFIAFVLALSSSVACSAEYDDLPKHFFELVEKGDIGAGLDYLAGTNPKMDRDSVDELRRKVVKMLSEFGAYSFHERLEEAKFGSRFAKLTYIIGYEHFPLEVTIVLYRPKDKWQLYGFIYKSTNDGGLTTPPRN